MSGELSEFLRWLLALGPSLIELFKGSGGDAAKAKRVMRRAYEAIDAEQAAEMARQRKATKAKGKP